MLGESRLSLRWMIGVYMKVSPMKGVMIFGVKGKITHQLSHMGIIP